MTRRSGPSSPFGAHGQCALHILGGLAAASAAFAPLGPALGADPPAIVFTQVPVRSVAGAPVGAAEGDLLPGSRIVRLDLASSPREPTVLTRGFLAAGKPDVSFDAKRILFVGRRSAAEPLDVWEMSVDGNGLRRVTEEVGNCSAAIYLSTIYTIDAAEPAHQIAFCSDRAGSGGARSLYTCRMDGTRIGRITFNPYGASDPCLLGDGRLLFSGGQPSAPGADGAAAGSALFTVNTDGTDVFVFAAVHESPAIRGMPCETPDGEVVYVESVRAGGHGGGSLVAVNRTASLRTRRVLARDPAGLYRSPVAMGDGSLLVSYRPHHGGSWGLYRLDAPRGERTAAVHDAPQWHEIDAAAIQVRAEPPGRSSVVDESATGLLYCLDAHLSDAEASPGRNERRIDSVQVFTAVAGRDPGSSGAVGEESRPSLVAATLLGTAPVESDGSFSLRIPAATPLRLRTLDADGGVVDAMRSWIWVMPREARGCIGCHEDRELSPPNRHALALRREPRRIDAARGRTTEDAR